MNTTEASSTFPPADSNDLGSQITGVLLEKPESERRGFSVQLATSLEVIESLRPVWTTWTHSLETDVDYFLHNMTSDPSVVHPYIITVYQRGVAQAMLLGLATRRRISMVVSYVPIQGPKANVLEIVHGGRLGPPNLAIDRVLAGELLKAIRHGGFDLVQFHRLAFDSDLFREVQQLSGPLVKQRAPHVFCYSTLSLTAPPGKKPAALSGKIRREARRKTRIILRAFPGRVRYQCFSHPAELPAGLRDAATIAADSWQRHLGDAALSDPRTMQALNFCAQQGWLRIFVLYTDERPRAFLIGQLYKRTFYCQHAGFEPDFARYSVGSLLTSWALERLADAGAEEVDLGEGGEEHNRRLGCRLQQEATLHVYSPSLRGLWLNMFVGSTQIVRNGGRKVRSRFELEGLKRAWARFFIARLRAKNTEDQEHSISERSRAA
jgi:CelD/BcsL family acetyltransferase involved in cellulose biosynthesis